MLLPLAYALLSLHSVKSDLEHGGELHFIRLLIIATGYVVGCCLLLAAQYSSPGLVFAVGIFIFSAIVVILLDGKYADRHKPHFDYPSRDDRVEATDEAQAVASGTGDRFADLNPNYAREHPQVRRLQNRQARKFPLWTTILAVSYFSVVIPADIYFLVMVPQEVDKLYCEAPLVKPEQLGNYVRSAKPIALEACTGKSLIPGHNIAFERLYSLDRHYRRRSSDWYSWDEHERYPADIPVTVGKTKTKILIDGYSTNQSYLDVFFLDTGSELNRAPIPSNWPVELAEGKNNFATSHFLVKGLPANTPVTIIGTVDLVNEYLPAVPGEPSGAGYVFRSFHYKGNDYPVIVSPLSPAKLRDFFATNHPVKPDLGFVRGEDTAFTQTAGRPYRPGPSDWKHYDYY